jgi:hypothetical protein
MPSGPIRGALAAAVLAALTLAACGGGGGEGGAGSSTPEQVTTQTRGSTTTTTQADAGAPAAHKKAKKKPGKGKPAAQGKSKHAHNGVAVAKGGAEKPNSSPAPPASAVPQQSNEAIFGIAKQMCSNPALIKTVPEGARGDDDSIATYAQMFAPQGQKQSAHDGCLAGLKSIGR